MSDKTPLTERLENILGEVCDSECRGRCQVCPANVVREAMTAIKAAEQSNADLEEKLRDSTAKLGIAWSHVDGLTKENAELKATVDKVREALGFDVVRQEVVDGRTVYVSPDAYYGLGGVIEDLKDARAADAVCIKTLKRVEEQLATAKSLLAKVPGLRKMVGEMG